MYDELGIEKVPSLWERLPKDVQDKIDELIEAGKNKRKKVQKKYTLLLERYLSPKESRE